MFCYQCEQTAHGTGCVEFGICGKDETVAALQDLLVHATKGIAMHAHRAGRLGVRDDMIGRFVLEALFTTVTNVNFDADRMVEMLREAGRMRDHARRQYAEACAAAGETPSRLRISAAVK